MVTGIGGSALVWQVGLLDPQAWCKTFLLLKLGVYLSHRPLAYQVPAVRASSAAYNAVTMERRGLAQIYSYDADFDKLEGMARQEP
jgi:hypothetical protein